MNAAKRISKMSKI
jgi:hypothetical protein